MIVFDIRRQSFLLSGGTDVQWFKLLFSFSLTIMSCADSSGNRRQTSRLILTNEENLDGVLRTIRRDHPFDSSFRSPHRNFIWELPESEVVWSEPRSSHILGVGKVFAFDLYRPEVCGVELMQKESSHWLAKLDFGCVLDLVVSFNHVQLFWFISYSILSL